MPSHPRANSYYLTAESVSSLEHCGPHHPLVSLVLTPCRHCRIQYISLGRSVRWRSGRDSKRYLHPSVERGIMVNDATSGHGGYSAYAEDGSWRIYVPSKNMTVCSGFNNCAERDAFTSWTHQRGVVEFLGCAFT